MKKYFRHFAALFIAIGVLLAIYLILILASGVLSEKTDVPSPVVDTYVNNEHVTDERVFDYANILTDAEENSLRELIAEKEAEIKCDIVLVIISDENYASDNAMMNFADDFYDENKFGYNVPYGDGCLYLDNWKNSSWQYNDSSFCWLSTSGRVEDKFSSYMISSLIDYVNEVIDDSPYEAYRRYVTYMSNTMADKPGTVGDGSIYSNYISVKTMLIIALIATLVYVLIFVSRNVGKKTTTASTYVISGRPQFLVIQDNFLNRHVIQRKIDTSSGGGGGGHHISSGGHSHGGGGGRH